MIHCNWCGGLGDAQVVQVHCRKGVDLYMMYGRVFGMAQTPKHPYWAIASSSILYPQPLSTVSVSGVLLPIVCDTSKTLP